jgi:uncharacterized protein
MEYIIIPIIALLASILTFFSGFGLGTILLPVFALFFPVDVAIILTAIVHFLNNAFKFVLVYKNIHWKTVWQFGLPAILFSFIGALLLYHLSDFSVLYTYNFFNKSFQVTWMKLMVAILLILFALFELLPSLKKLHFDPKYLPLGGVLSGFFGGLSGHQGALRSSFLSKIGLSKESFIATGVVIACMVDISRMGVYLENFAKTKNQFNLPLIVLATLSAFIGVYVGNKLLQKITINFIQKIVAVMIILFAVLLGLGWV